MTGLGARHRDHIRPVLVNLHWLPVRKRVTFKTAVLVWKCLHDAAPCYLMDLCWPVTSADGRHLHLATSWALFVPRTRTTIGQGSFTVHGPTMWNRLPAPLRSLELTLPMFRRRLKTHLFQQWFLGQLGELIVRRCFTVSAISAPSINQPTQLTQHRWVSTWRSPISYTVRCRLRVSSAWNLDCLDYFPTLLSHCYHWHSVIVDTTTLTSEVCITIDKCTKSFAQLLPCMNS